MGNAGGPFDSAGSFVPNRTKTSTLRVSPARFVGEGRFDDPSGAAAYRVLSAGERRACFYETLADFRPHPRTAGTAHGAGPSSWFERRLIGCFELVDVDRSRTWLDLTSAAAFTDFRIRFRELLEFHGFHDFDLSAATTDRRSLTTAIGRWAFQPGYRGIQYVTRHTPALSCWAIFEGVAFQVIDAGSEIAFDDPDLIAVAADLNLVLPAP